MTAIKSTFLKLRTFLIFFCTLSLFVLWCGCHTQHSVTSREKATPNGILRIGYADTPPIIFRNGKEMAGVEADLGTLLAERLGMQPKFILYPFDKLSDALLTKKIDIIMAGMTITDLRRVRMDFTNPYLEVGQMALVRGNEMVKYNTSIKIRTANANVGVVEGTTGEQIVDDYFVNAHRVSYNNAADALQGLLTHRIDMFIYDAPSVWWLASQNDSILAVAPALLTQEAIGWAIRRENPVLRDEANKAIAEWQQDGTLEAIFYQWGIPYSKK